MYLISRVWEFTRFSVVGCVDVTLSLYDSMLLRAVVEFELSLHV